MWDEKKREKYVSSVHSVATGNNLLVPYVQYCVNMSIDPTFCTTNTQKTLYDTNTVIERIIYKRLTVLCVLKSVLDGAS